MQRDILVRTARLGGAVMGLWDESTRTLWLDAGLTPAERRSTLAHELVHAERGDVPCGDDVLDARQELWVEREAARRLVRWEALVEAARWSEGGDVREVADLLGVDVETVRVRLADLSPQERHALGEIGGG